MTDSPDSSLKPKGLLREPLIDNNEYRDSNHSCCEVISRCFQSTMMLILLTLLVAVAFILFVFSFIQACPTDSTRSARIVGCAFFASAAVVNTVRYLTYRSSTTICRLWWPTTVKTTSRTSPMRTPPRAPIVAAVERAVAGLANRRGGCGNCYNY